MCTRVCTREEGDVGQCVFQPQSASITALGESAGKKRHSHALHPLWLLQPASLTLHLRAAVPMLQTRKVLVSSVMGKFGKYQVRSRDRGAEGGSANQGGCLALSSGTGTDVQISGLARCGWLSASTRGQFLLRNRE